MDSPEILNLLSLIRLDYFAHVGHVPIFITYVATAQLILVIEHHRFTSYEH